MALFLVIIKLNLDSGERRWFIQEMSSHFNPNCAGYQVFTEDLSQIVLVFNAKGIPSFPKGKREHINKDKRQRRETPEETAIRELKEETGLTKKDIRPIPEVITYEDSNSGKAGEIFLGTAILLDPNFKFDPIDKAEILRASLITIEEAMKILAPKRQRVL